MQENPLLQRILASVEGQEAGGVASDWRLMIESAAPKDREPIIIAAVRDVIASVLRVKPESLRHDQPLTDLGLDSLMGVEIENSLEAALGVALPPTSLMRARTIGQIAALIAGYMGGKTATPAPAPAAAPVEASVTEDVDLDALSDEELGKRRGFGARGSRARATPRARENPLSRVTCHASVFGWLGSVLLNDEGRRRLRRPSHYIWLP